MIIGNAVMPIGERLLGPFFNQIIRFLGVGTGPSLSYDWNDSWIISRLKIIEFCESAKFGKPSISPQKAGNEIEGRNSWV